MATIGTESMYASDKPVTRFVAPGPDVAMQTPTLPVATAYPSAACAAPCSCRTRMWRILESNNGSYAGRIVPPGMPKMTSTPTASSDAIRDCAPVMICLLSESTVSVISRSSVSRSLCGSVVHSTVVIKKPPLPVGRRGCVSRATMATDTLSKYEDVTHGLTFAHEMGTCQNQGPSGGRADTVPARRRGRPEGRPRCRYSLGGVESVQLTETVSTTGAAGATPLFLKMVKARTSRATPTTRAMTPIHSTMVPMSQNAYAVRRAVRRVSPWNRVLRSAVYAAFCVVSVVALTTPPRAE